jgi:polyhydroxyalkanoate synthesis regulator phasin
MAGLGDIVQKALYLGVGLATYATEKAGITLQELKIQGQKLADELVARGEMTAEEARKYVDELVQQAQQPVSGQTTTPQNSEPRRIEILDDLDNEDEKNLDPQNIDQLRQQVQSLQEELRKLNRS